MLLVRTSRCYLSKIHSRLGIHRSYIETQKLSSATNQVHTIDSPFQGSYRFFTHSSVKFIEQSSTPASDQATKTGELTEYHAFDMIHKLSDNDRKSLSKALSRYDSEKTKSKFQGNYTVTLKMLLIERFSKEQKNKSIFF